MDYRGYKAAIRFDEDDEIFVGRVLGLNDIISFDGTTTADLKAAFKGVVDSYLETCKATGKQPEKQYSGKFVLRATPDMHRELSLAAEQEDLSLNEFVLNRLFSKPAKVKVKARTNGKSIRTRKRA